MKNRWTYTQIQATRFVMQEQAIRQQLEEHNVAFVIVRHFGSDELPTPTNRIGRAANIPTITYASSCFLEMTRFTEEECIGQSWSILQGRETDPIRWNSLALCLASGESRQEMMKVAKRTTKKPKTPMPVRLERNGACAWPKSSWARWAA